MPSAPRREPDGAITTADGLRLALYEWRVPEPTGTVLILHGMGEHMGRYDHVARALNAAGAEAIGIDFRGHGESDSEYTDRVHVDDFGLYGRDVDAVVGRVGATRGHALAAIVAHSMGGLVLCDWLLTRSPPAPRRFVLSSPYFGPRAAWWLLGARPLVMSLARLTPRLRLPVPFDAADLSRDPVMQDAYRNDPRVRRGVTARWLESSLRTAARVIERVGELPGSFQVVRSDSDPVVDTSRIERFERRRAGDGRPVILAGARHEVLNDEPATRDRALAVVCSLVLPERT